MTYLLNKTASWVFMAVIIFFTSCELNEIGKVEAGSPALIYLTQLEDGAINLTSQNVVVDKLNQTMLLVVGVHRSGLQSREAFSVDFQLDNSKIPAGTVAFKPTEYTLSLSKTTATSFTKINVPVNVSSVPIYITIPKSAFDANTGKKLAMHISISNPTKYALNEDLVQTDIIFEPSSFAYTTSDITATYIRNPGGTTPFLREDTDGTRFGILKDWTFNSVVKNQDGNQHGGFDSFGSGAAMSMEKFSATTPAITNGKIYQTFTLPAGKYLFQVDFQTAIIADQAWVAVAAGNILPDVTNLPGGALGATKFLTNTSANSIKVPFDVPVAQQVSMGIVANFVTGNNAFRATAVKLTQLKNPFEY